MRSLSITSVVAALAFGASALGQEPYWRHTTDRAASGASRGFAGDDSLRPYGTRGAAPARGRGYARETSPARIEPARAPSYSARRNYFPGQRTGQYPNRNYIAPERLCVPGRRAFLYR